MARKKSSTNSDANVGDYRHKGTKRKNIPPAKLAAEGTVPVLPKLEYSYSPRRPPVLRFDAKGGADQLPELIAEAKKRKLTDEEARILANALRTHEPWLEWTGKREIPGFAVDPVALHIHERVSAQAILKIAARQDVNRSLFADPEQDYKDAVQFYRHDVEWSNRLILGDSMQVMASLAKREDLAGKVQMIYMDPPYGIKFASNFQPEVGKRDVKDKESDLTREPETVKAYRDTWHLGIHSYLSYLRDRLIVARDLLSDTGSIFVQISDENIHRVRSILDEVFGVDNFVSQIFFQKTGGLTPKTISNIGDHLLWYSRVKEKLKYNRLHDFQSEPPIDDPYYSWLQFPDGSYRKMNAEEKNGLVPLPDNARVFRHGPLMSSGASTTEQTLKYQGKNFVPSNGNHWKTSPANLERVDLCDHLFMMGNQPAWKLFWHYSPGRRLANVWLDTQSGGFNESGLYVVQTTTKVIQRCMLMTTDPGDLVLDPTCGSGTTAYVAEQWGRRWITTDTSRVAIAIARQRLLTAKYDYYELCEEKTGVAGNFKYKTVPHITLKSIAQNQNLNPIFAKHEPNLEAILRNCNASVVKVPAELRKQLDLKLAHKEQKEGKRAVTDADRRRWNLPGKGETWEHWTVPFDTDPDWPKELQTAVAEYRKAWRAKMDEVNACIAANAQQEELVDQPVIERGKTRVSGPFTVEAVQPPEINLGEPMEFSGAPDEIEGTFVMREVIRSNELEVKNVEAYLEQMTKLLKLDGVRFPNNKEMAFSRLERINDSSGLHAEGRWFPKGDPDPNRDGEANVGVVFGPQYGPFTVPMLENLIKPAKRRYDALVVAAFNFSAEVADLADNHQVKDFRIHIAHIRPDVNPGMAGLLKEQPGSQLFTVFGLPRVLVNGPNISKEYTVVMEGVDVYNPVDNSIVSTGANKVAAWFLDGDYDGRTFCVTQAFFPDKGAWEKLAKALGSVVDPERFEALSGTTSLPFPVGKHKCVAVKVIDPRGNEVMQVQKLL